MSLRLDLPGSTDNPHYCPGANPTDNCHELGPDPDPFGGMDNTNCTLAQPDSDLRTSPADIDAVEVP